MSGKPHDARRLTGLVPGPGDQPLFDRLVGYLDGTNWRYQAIPEDTFIEMRTAIADANVRVVLDVYESEDLQRVLVLALLPVFVPNGRRQAVLEALNRINFNMAYGSVEMDPEYRELRVRTVVEADKHLDEAMMERALHSCLNTADRFFSPLMAVAFGNAKPETIMDLAGNEPKKTLQ